MGARDGGCCDGRCVGGDRVSDSDFEQSLSGSTTHELSDRELIAALYGDVQSLASIVATMADKMDSAERSITQIVEEVKPTLDKLQKSPLVKMLGG